MDLTPNSMLPATVCRSRQVQFEICHEQFSVREILKAKLPEPGGGSIWSAAGRGEQEIDAATGDAQSRL